MADIRGRLSGLNDLAREAGAKAIIHTGDFGFFGESCFCLYYSVKHSIESLPGTMDVLNCYSGHDGL